MRQPIVYAVSLVALLSLLILHACKTTEPKARNPVEFTGYVFTWKDGNEIPVPAAEVQIGDFKSKTDDQGYFKMVTETSERYALNIRKKEFGLTSRVIYTPKKDDRYYLYPATVQEFDPNQDIVLTDTGSKDRPGAPASRAEWKKDSSALIPLVYENGRLVDFGFSTEMQAAFDYVVSRKQAGNGATVRIPAQSLVSRSGNNQPNGKVNVSLSTIDLFSPGAMPGDFTVFDEKRKVERGFMISFGAASIDIWDEDNDYTLADGKSASIEIPLDPGQLNQPDSIPESITLYWYNEDTGYWQENGIAKLNREKSVYEGEIRHFSSFNMDYEKVTPACIKVRHTGAVADLTSYQVEVIAMKGSNIVHNTVTITEPGGCLVKSSSGTGLHQLYNLPDNEQICMIFYDAANVPVSIIVPTTSATYAPNPRPDCTEPACPGPCADEALCDDDANPCSGYAGCEYVQFAKKLDLLLLAAEKASATSVTLKWVYRGEPVGTTYTITETDGPGGGCANVAFSGTQGPITTRSITGGHTVYEMTITGVAPGNHFYTVTASDATASDCFSSEAVTLP